MRFGLTLTTVFAGILLASSLALGQDAGEGPAGVAAPAPVEGPAPLASSPPAVAAEAATPASAPEESPEVSPAVGSPPRPTPQPPTPQTVGQKPGTARPEGALAPGVFPPAMDGEAKRDLFGFSRERLGRAYRLVPNEVYLRAQANAQAEGVPCPGEGCNDKIQELLKVTRVMHLEISQSGETATLNLALVRGREKFQRSETCQGCTVTQLKRRLQNLVAGVVTEDLGAPPPMEELAREGDQNTDPVPPQEPKVKSKSLLPDIPLWVYIAGGAVLLGLLASAGGGGGDDGSGATGEVGITW